MKTVLIGAIAIYRSVIKNPQSIVEEIKKSYGDLWEDSLLYGGNKNSNIRTSSEIKNIPEDINSNLDSDFKQAVSDYVCRFNAPISSGSSAYILLKYEVGQEFKLHYDDSFATPRRISAVGFLNDDYRGGQLSFDLMNFTYEPVAGDIVVFPSNFPYMHAARPVIEGTKYSVVNWWN